MILVSACLAGVECSWDGKGRAVRSIKEMVEKKEAIAACPEVLGGRSIPRRRAEIKSASGEDVLDGKARVYDEDGRDITDEFLKGAYKTLEIAKHFNIKKAILKSRSPSCGCGLIYDGGFSGRLVKGNGVTAALLMRNGIKVLCRNF